jgi:ribosomal protein S18 acetylase RimI-like enzyme
MSNPIMSPVIMDEVTFRPYSPDDLPACAALAVDAWPTVAAGLSPDNLHKFMTAYVEVARLESTRLEVACISDRVVALLFGSFNKDYTLKFQAKAALEYFVLGLKFFSGRYGRLDHPRTFMKHFRATERKVEQNSPRSDAVVQLFVVSSECRGQGIGRTMMDRFVDAAHAHEAQVITLYTDPLSNWHFYEKYGFTRYSVFEDDLNSYLMDEPMQSYIYALELGR